jgi:5-methylcytosine-specific restriction endonuclease McrA
MRGPRFDFSLEHHIEATMTVAATVLRTLVLNADYRPLSTWPLSLVTGQEAVRAVFRDRATVVEEWDQVFRSPSIEIRVAKVIALREYAPISAAPKFCRRSILLRDRFRCQYCGERFESHELTFDHVIPRSVGGQTVWENILSACVECNKRKRDTLPNYSARVGQLRPLKAPRQPSTAELLRAGLQFLDPELRADFGSWLYWNSELQA